ncbi:MAG: intradiol ring-cleavage dioxygenase, partial [Aureliella sp.]
MLETAAAAVVLSGSGRLFADELLATAALTEGPFYPDQLPLDTDNDLIILNDAITPAVGE